MSRKPVKGIMPTEHRLKISAGVRQSLGEAINQSDVQSINSNSRVRLPDPGWMVATIFNKDKVPVWFCVSKDPNRNFLDQTQRKPNEFGHGKFYGHEGLTLMVSPRVFYDKGEAKAFKDQLIHDWGITTSEGQRPPYEQIGKPIPGSIPRRKGPKGPRAKAKPTLFQRIKGFFANLYFGIYLKVKGMFDQQKTKRKAKSKYKPSTNPNRKPYTWSSPEARQANIDKRFSTKVGRPMPDEQKAKIAKSVKKTMRKKQRAPMSDETKLRLMIAIEERKAQGLPFGRPKGVKNAPKRKPYTWSSPEARQANIDKRFDPRKK